MAIRCCKGCVPPERYPGCHDHCPKYQEAKAVHDEQKAEEDRKKDIRHGLYIQRTQAIKRIKNKKG